MKKLTRKEKHDLWSRLRKENSKFRDLCDERDKIVRIVEHHDIVKQALISELEKWDGLIDEVFRKLINKKIRGVKFE